MTFCWNAASTTEGEVGPVWPKYVENGFVELIANALFTSVAARTEILSPASLWEQYTIAPDLRTDGGTPSRTRKPA